MFWWIPLCNAHPGRDIKHSYMPAVLSGLLPLTLLNAATSPEFYSSKAVYLLLNFTYNGTTAFVLFCISLLLLSIIFFEVYPYFMCQCLFPFYHQVSHCCSSIFLLMDVWAVAPFGFMNKASGNILVSVFFAHVCFHFSGGKYPGIELLGSMVVYVTS